LLVPSSISIRQLEYFVAVARTGSMARAATTLHVSPAAVSLGIGQLERALECDLFLRRPHQPLSLTGTGRELLARAATIVSDTEEFEQAANQRAGSVGGTIRVGCFDTLAPFLVPQLLVATTERYPELVVDVTEGTSESLQSHLVEGTSDLAIMYGLEIRKGLRLEVLWTVRPYVVLPVDHHLADRRSIRLAELRTEPMILLDAPPSRFHVLTALAGVGISPLVARVTRNFETLRSLVARGYGWGLLVQHPVVDRSYEGLPIRRVEIDDPIEPAPVVVATVANATLSRRTLACVEVLRGLNGGLGGGGDKLVDDRIRSDELSTSIANH
jgi:DNA-binding transcriptional LysR family regulator